MLLFRSRRVKQGSAISPAPEDLRFLPLSSPSQSLSLSPPPSPRAAGAAASDTSDRSCSERPGVRSQAMMALPLLSCVDREPPLAGSAA